MEAFWKTAAAVLLAVILALVLDKQEKDISVLLTIAVCTLAGGIALSYLRPVVDFLFELKEAGGLREDFLKILLQAAGVGVSGELIGCICADAGKGAFGKALQMLGSAVMLYLSVPMLRALLTMIQQILGGL